MKRWSWRSFVVGAAAGVLVVGGPFLYYAAQQQAQADYTACLADLGYFPNDPSIDTYDELDELVTASEQCL